jgi:type VI protein secretion system component Hcp
MADHTATRRTLLAGTLSMSPTDTGNGVGKLKPQPFVFVKHVDKATPVLFLKCTTCQHVPQATLTARKRASRSPTEVVLRDVHISSCRTAPGSVDAVPLDVVGLD